MFGGTRTNKDITALEALFKRGLCLPSGPCVTEEDVAYIIKTIKDCL